MKYREILADIANTGDCEHLSIQNCQNCPLGRIKRRPDDNGWLSCYESICGSGSMVLEKQRELYKAAAREKLADLAIEEAISCEKHGQI